MDERFQGNNYSTWNLDICRISIKQKESSLSLKSKFLLLDLQSFSETKDNTRGTWTSKLRSTIRTHFIQAVSSQIREVAHRWPSYSIWSNHKRSWGHLGGWTPYIFLLQKIRNPKLIFMTSLGAPFQKWHSIHYLQ